MICNVAYGFFPRRAFLFLPSAITGRATFSSGPSVLRLHHSAAYYSAIFPSNLPRPRQRLARCDVTSKGIAGRNP